jgi:hypothetical protein
MSKVERRHERAIAVLKTIARTMGNAVFRVEDYPPLHEKRVHTGQGSGGERTARGHEEIRLPPSAPVEMVFDKPSSLALEAQNLKPRLFDGKTSSRADFGGHARVGRQFPAGLLH